MKISLLFLVPLFCFQAMANEESKEPSLKKVKCSMTKPQDLKKKVTKK